jgi:hypothetical protein
MHLLADIGPATSVFKALAGSVGAGLVVGGFVGGASALVVNRSRSTSEQNAVTGGYVGGAFALLLLLIDILMKSFV